MGLRASHTVSLSLSDVRVPNSAVLGQLGEGFKIAMMALDGGRIGISGQSLGMAYGALERARELLLEDPAQLKSQGAQFKLADIGTECDAAWLLALRAAWLKETDQPFQQRSGYGQSLRNGSCKQSDPKSPADWRLSWPHERPLAFPLLQRLPSDENLRGNE